MIGFPFDSRVTYEGDTPVFDRAISSEPYRRLLKRLFLTGIDPSEQQNMQVVSNNAMSVRVKAGFAMVEGCMKLEEGDKVLTIDTADTNYDRIDTVVLRLNDNESVRACEYAVIKGTPATNPTAPDLVRASSIYDIGLANVRVPKGATSIATANITDTRFDSARCGIISPLAKVDATNLFQQFEAAFNDWFELNRAQLEAVPTGELLAEVQATKKSVSDGKALVASAITEKRVATEADATFAQMASNIARITLGSGNATRDQVLNERTFTNDDGVEYSGTMPNRSGGANASNFTKSESEWFRAWAPEGYYAEGAPVWVNPAYMGNASAADVVKGKTFTSQLGLQIVGTANPVAVASEGFSDGSYGRDRTFVTSKEHKSAVIVLACGYGGASSGTAPSITANKGTLEEIIRKANYYGSSGHGFSLYKVSNMPSGTTISINYGGSQYYYGYGQSMYIIDADF